MNDIFSASNQPLLAVSQQLSGHGTSPTILVPDRTGDFQVGSIICVSQDSIAHVFTPLIYQGGSFWALPSVNLAALAGNGTVPALDYFAVVNLANLTALAMNPTWGLYWQLDVNLSTGAMNVFAFGVLL